MSKRFTNGIFQLAVVIIGFWLALDLIAHLVAEILWFQEVHYLSVFLGRFQAQFGLWILVCFVSLTCLLSNLNLAQRWQHSPSTKINPQQERQFPLSLSLFLPIVIFLSFLVGLMLFNYGQIALRALNQNIHSGITLSLPSLFKPSTLTDLISQLLPISLPGQLKFAILLGIIIFILTKFQWALQGIAILLSLIFALVGSQNWVRVLQAFNPTPFEQTEPLFQQDISFYVFQLPLGQLLEFWLSGLFLYALISTTLIYLLSGESLAQGKFSGFSWQQLRHLYMLSGITLLSLAFYHWLERYNLLYSQRGVSYGAGYTGVKIGLPVESLLSGFALAIALWLLWRGLSLRIGKGQSGWIAIQVRGNTLVVSLIFIGAYFFTVLMGALLPQVIQRLAVQPNELARERPYIERSIQFTRSAFALDNIEVRTFDPQGNLTAQQLEDNHLTIDNIRLWDTRPLLQANRQLQQIRLYYRFPDADIDRYTLQPDSNFSENQEQGKEPDSTKRLKEISTRRQVIIAARELDYSSVPAQAQTWVNEHLVYTHGYGFTLSPVNQAAEGGLPDYFIKDITPSERGELGTLSTADQRIRNSIPIGQPRIYYGEMTNTYVMTGTKVEEFDYPQGDENASNTYNGTGGISIGSWERRLLFAQYLKDWQMLFTQDFTPETKLLFRRNITERVKAIAPFLRYDHDLYLVTANTGESENYLYWILDAYTNSNRYPYSDPGSHKFNYLRNSVKVVIDAYNGDVDFYIAEPNDPLIRTWAKLFPELFKPLESLPSSLRSHLRYPQDLFKVQSERLLAYHMIDPQVFYNREDQWEIPTEIYGTQAQSIEPYYLIMKLPTATVEEFILLHPYTPTGRNNLIAWLAGRSDGQQYGKLLLYQFPKQRLIYGPNQIEALINQDPVISQQISLWDRQGSHAIQGNLLIIPIEQSLLYVEPLYLEAEENSLPTLARVIVVYENRIVMAKTLEEAFQEMFVSF